MKWRAFMVFATLWHDEHGKAGGRWTPKYLGDVEAPTEAAALEFTRETWPIPASCAADNRLLAGHHVEDAAEMDRRIAARRQGEL